MKVLWEVNKVMVERDLVEVDQTTKSDGVLVWVYHIAIATPGGLSYVAK